MKAESKLKLQIIKAYLKDIVIVLLVISVVALLLGKIAEAIFFIMVHFLLRPAFNKQLHFANDNICLLVSCMIGILAVIFIFPLSISLLSVVPITFFVCWFGCVIAINNEIKPKSITNMDKIEFDYHCRNNGLNENEIIIAELVFREQLKGKDLYRACNYSEIHVKRMRVKIKKKLNL